MTPEAARAELEAICSTRPLDGRGGLAVGVFGDSLPPALVRAAGVAPVDVTHAPEGPEPDLPQVAALIEPFQDATVRRFLLRFAAGAFDGLAGLVFCRAEAAGLAAFRYASEMRRQGLAPKGPPLHLWNLTHGTSPAVQRFNGQQARDLGAWLAGLGCNGPGLPVALEAERRRCAALAGAPTFPDRMAGRWLDPETHVRLLTARHGPGAGGSRLGLVGSAWDSPAAYAMLAGVGTLIADLTPLGLWPPRPPDDADPLAALAADPLHLRANPPGAYRPALVARLRAAGCRLVVAQVAPQDDAFGWEVPSLARDLTAVGIRLLDLGPRPDRPGAAWLAAARARLDAALAEIAQ